MSGSRLKSEAERWKTVGASLKGGELVLSPFEDPVEEERRGDPDQTDDDQNFAQGSYTCESREPAVQTLTKEIGDVKARRFHFFLDGSIRTKYLGEYVTNFGGFPLIVSEIVVAVVRCEGQLIRPESLLNRVYLVFPHKDSGMIPDGTYDNLQALQGQLEGSNSMTRIEFMKKAAISPNIRFSLLAKVRGIMHDLEHQVAKALAKDDQRWLIMDGAVRSDEFAGLKNTIGVAKSFSRKPMLEVSHQARTVPSYMRHLREGQRSHVFSIINPTSPVLRDVVFWYVRLRVFPPMEPLGGIVKIDLHTDMIPQAAEGLTEIADEISAEIYSMRLPSVYPWPRWPSYIYPIRTAESYMSASFFSPFVLARIGNEIKDSMGSP